MTVCHSPVYYILPGVNKSINKRKKDLRFRKSFPILSDSALRWLPLILGAANPFIVERAGRLHVWREVYLDRVADHRHTAQQQPQDKGEVQLKELALIAVRHPFGLPDTVHGAELRVVDHDIYGHAVAVGGHDPRNHEEQGPEGDKEILQDDEPEKPRHHAEAVQQVCKHRTGPPDGVEGEDREADGDHRQRKLQQQVDQTLAGAGRSPGQQVHRGFALSA